MDEPLATDRGGDLGRVALGGEFRRMHADDDDFLGKGFLDAPQGRQDVHAIDAAERPEIENDEATAQLPQGQWRRRVEPDHAGDVGLRCAYLALHDALPAAVISIWDVPASRAGCKALPATLGRTPGEKTRRHNNVETPLEISPMLINRLVPRRRRSAGVQRGVASSAVALLPRFFWIVARWRCLPHSTTAAPRPMLPLPWIALPP